MCVIDRPIHHFFSFINNKPEKKKYKRALIYKNTIFARFSLVLRHYYWIGHKTPSFLFSFLNMLCCTRGVCVYTFIPPYSLYERAVVKQFSRLFLWSFNFPCNENDFDFKTLMFCSSFSHLQYNKKKKISIHYCTLTEFYWENFDKSVFTGVHFCTQNGSVNYIRNIRGIDNIGNI